MERTITYTTASELKYGEERSGKSRLFPKTLRSDHKTVEGSHKNIEQVIERLKQEGAKVHNVTLQKQCEHCFGKGHKTVADASFDEVVHSEPKAALSEPTHPQMEASCIPH